MNAAYTTLLRRLPSSAAFRLRTSQRAWVVFRDAEARTLQALYETRSGTIFVPMESDATTTIVRDRANLLERYIRALDID